jgi:hypothetical protein
MDVLIIEKTVAGSKFFYFLKDPMEKGRLMID